MTVDNVFKLGFTEDAIKSNGEGTVALSNTPRGRASTFTGRQVSLRVPVRVGEYRVTQLGSHAFRDCKFHSLYVPEGVTSIGVAVFESCANLRYLYLPRSLKQIGEYALNACSNLKGITYKGTVMEWAAIQKDFTWSTGAPHFTVHCRDGEVEIN